MAAGHEKQKSPAFNEDRATGLRLGANQDVITKGIQPSPPPCSEKSKRNHVEDGVLALPILDFRFWIFD
jgi:hypothetical protein